jgi:hypothetical protein
VIREVDATRLGIPGQDDAGGDVGAGVLLAERQEGQVEERDLLVVVDTGGGRRRERPPIGGERRPRPDHRIGLDAEDTPHTLVAPAQVGDDGERGPAHSLEEHRSGECPLNVAEDGGQLELRIDLLLDADQPLVGVDPIEEAPEAGGFIVHVAHSWRRASAAGGLIARRRYSSISGR